MAAQQAQHAQRLIRGNALYRPGAALLFLHSIFFVALITAGNVYAESLLLAQHEKLKTELAQSVFGLPIVLNSNTSKHHAQGEVFAVLDTPIGVLQDILSQPKYWCDLAILHINVKACTFRIQPESQQLIIYLGRKYYQPPSQAHPLKYNFDQLQNINGHLFVQLTAPDGPFGTHDYLISFEAVPIDEKRSFIRFQYRYQFGFLARIAMKTYLATIGHKKVGFTIDGIDLEGKPANVKGVQGVVERNAIRYIYAIQSLLDAMKLPETERQQQSLNNWYTNISKHPRQLVEFTREEYLERKQQELKNQFSLQKEIQQSN